MNTHDAFVSTLGIAAAAAIVLILTYAIGATRGAIGNRSISRDEFEHEAVMHGAADYVPGENGEPVFKWRTQE